MSTRESRRARLAGSVALAALAVLVATAVSRDGGSTAVAAAPRTWYVDCKAAPGGTGTRAKPLATLAAVNNLTLAAGDQVRLRRGTVCTGMLAPTGNGTATRPIVIGTYGTASARPRIDGGGTVEAAVFLANTSYITVDGIELTNSGDHAGVHRGAYFTSTRVVKGITLQHLFVHDVDGTDSLNGGKAGGGIVGWALTSGAWFASVAIEDNVVQDVSRQGITVFGTVSNARPAATSTWPAASSGIVIRGNTVDGVRGDGILPMGTVGALVEHNIVRRANLGGFDHNDANKRNCAVGIWTFHANRTTIQYNEVSNMHFGPSTKPASLNGCDGEAFDVDYDQDGTVIQYNYSHNNDGGFVLLCTAAGKLIAESHHADVRFNLSVDDNATFNPTTCQANPRSGVNNLNGLRMYNNTIVAATPRVTAQLDESAEAAMVPYFGNFVFENNLVYATASGAGSHPFDCGKSCVTNLFFKRPPPSTAERSISADPRFVNVSRRGAGSTVASAFRLRAGSPASKAGTNIPTGVPADATTNYFGDPVTAPPSIGFD